MSYTLGIDPGKVGAIAILRDDGSPEAVHRMPLIASTKGKSEYDERALRDLLSSVARQRWSPGVASPLVVWEALQTLPPKMGGGVANFQRGLAVGLLRGICAGLGLRSQAYRPQEWQREMLAGTIGDDTKQRALIAAGRLFPGVCLVCFHVGGAHLDHGRRTKPQDGAADSLLLAEFGRRRALGMAA